MRIVDSALEKEFTPEDFQDRAEALVSDVYALSAASGVTSEGLRLKVFDRATGLLYAYFPEDNMREYFLMSAECLAVYSIISDVHNKEIKTGQKVLAAPCVFCGRRLEPIGDTWEYMQPNNGGEVQFIFSYGSSKFDNYIGQTKFQGVICDDCASDCVKHMRQIGFDGNGDEIERIPCAPFDGIFTDDTETPDPVLWAKSEADIANGRVRSAQEVIDDLHKKIEADNA